MNEIPEYRKSYEKKSIVLGRILARMGFTPNMMTISSIIVATISLYYFMNGNLIQALAIIIIAGILDIFDGAIARATGKTSKFGTLLDNTADRIVESIIILGLTLGEYIRAWIAILTLISMFLPSYIRARGEAELNVKALGVGLFERKEKLGTLFVGMILAWYLNNSLVRISTYIFNILEIACIVVIIGSLITAVQRLLFFRNKEIT